MMRQGFQVTMSMFIPVDPADPAAIGKASAFVEYLEDMFKKAADGADMDITDAKTTMLMGTKRAPRKKNGDVDTVSGENTGGEPQGGSVPGEGEAALPTNPEASDTDPGFEGDDNPF